MLDDRHLPPHSVARWAAATPDNLALHEVGGRQVTYAELDVEARRWAVGLARLGVGAGSHVGTMLSLSIDAPVALIALAWLRAVEVPINVAHRGQMLQYVLDLADVTTLVIDSALVERFAEVASDCPQVSTIVVVGDESAATGLAPCVISASEMLAGAAEGGAAGRVPDPELSGPTARDVAALLFTSGTTGPSKAVIAPWGLIYSIWSWVPDDAVMPGEGFLCSLPMFHNSGRSGFVNAMDRGATFSFREKFSATSFWDDVRSTGAVVAASVGPLTSLLWSAEPRDDDADNPLRGMILGPMIPQMDEFEARFGVRVATCYGQTEVGCPVATGWDHAPWANCGRQRLTWPYNEVRVVDENDDPVPAGVVGELVVRSPESWAMNLGYYKMPEETVEAWRNGWFHTGDAFRVDGQGWFYFVDRMRDSIRRRGENISSFEVEVVLNRHPDVVEGAAIAIRTEHGDDEVMAALVVNDRSTFDPAAFVAWLEPQLPRFMVPRYVETFVDLPRNQTTLRVRKTDLRTRGITDSTWDREKATS